MTTEAADRNVDDSSRSSGNCSSSSSSGGNGSGSGSGKHSGSAVSQKRDSYLWRW